MLHLQAALREAHRQSQGQEVVLAVAQPVVVEPEAAIVLMAGSCQLPALVVEQAESQGFAGEHVGLLVRGVPQAELEAPVGVLGQEPVPAAEADGWLLPAVVGQQLPERPAQTAGSPPGP